MSRTVKAIRVFVNKEANDDGSDGGDGDDVLTGTAIWSETDLARVLFGYLSEVLFGHLSGVLFGHLSGVLFGHLSEVL